MIKKLGKVAFLWDESFLWGIMALKAFNEAGLDHELVRSVDIKAGCLKEGYSALFVPGGWASNKIKALGEEGCSNIRDFVKAGGNYIGFCGGAGLATSDGLALLNVKRKPTKDRVPSFSGPISLNIGENDLWRNIDADDIDTNDIDIASVDTAETAIKTKSNRFKSAVFNVWWPSQFVIGESSKIEVLATYGEAMPDSYSSDIRVGNIKSNSEWKQIESDYGINLDPKRMYGDPAVIMGAFGKGKVFLSLVHFDTPGDENGIKVLNGLARLMGINADRGAVDPISKILKHEYSASTITTSYVNNPHDMNTSSGLNIALTANHVNNENKDTTIINGGNENRSINRTLLEIEQTARSIIDIGLQEKLWFWRNPMLLQWRRGVRGLEYCNLYIMAKTINMLNANNATKKETPKMTAESTKAHKFEAMYEHNHDSFLTKIEDFNTDAITVLDNRLEDALKNIKIFRDKAAVLLFMEASLIKNGEIPGISYSNCNDENVNLLRTELFGTAKSHGGLFKTIINNIDEILYESIGNMSS